MDRFWSKVNKKSDVECWEWLANKHYKGYGHFKIGLNNVKAHRFSYELEYGEIPEGLWVLHLCDNPSCVNPKHLFLGTNQDNVNDKVSKNRQYRPIGESNPMFGVKGASAPNAVLSEVDVLHIRNEYCQGHISMRKLAKKYSVSYTTVQGVISRRTWSHI